LNLVYIAKSYGLNEVADYWEQVIIMNDHQKRRFSNNIVQTLYNTVSDKKITFLGWAFKKDTNDTRESAAIYVADDLINENAKIAVYDPKVSRKKMLADLDYLESRTTEKNTNSMQSFENPYEACNEAHAIAVLTEWDEFVQYDWQRIYDSMQKPAFVFDGRNILNGPALEKIGFVYQSIGS
jgi:UDPglucose 6-dehydrogenase